MLLKQALEDRKVVSFVYNDKPRLVEPHAVGYSIKDGALVMRGYQLDEGWKLFKVEQMQGLRLKDDWATPSARPGYKAGDQYMRDIIAELPA